MKLKNKKLLLAASGSVLFMLMSFTTLVPTAFADHGRTPAECSRLETAEARTECLAHAETDGLTDATASGQEGEIGKINFNDPEPENTCGEGDVAVKTSFDFGCSGSGNAIVDLALAVFRFLSAGVGILAVGSIIVAGIQFSASQGDPRGTQAAIKRASSTVGALFLYMLIYALIEWLVPGGLFN